VQRDVDELPLLDSFIKESIRCNHSDASKSAYMIEKQFSTLNDQLQDN
jgi:hypothetical protein